MYETQFCSWILLAEAIRKAYGGAARPFCRAAFRVFRNRAGKAHGATTGRFLPLPIFATEPWFRWSPLYAETIVVLAWRISRRLQITECGEQAVNYGRAPSDERRFERGIRDVRKTTRAYVCVCVCVRRGGGRITLRDGTLSEVVQVASATVTEMRKLSFPNF